MSVISGVVLAAPQPDTASGNIGTLLMRGSCTSVMLMAFTHEILWLRPVHFFTKIAVEKGWLNVKVVHLPALLSYDCKKQPNLVQGRDRGKHFIVIDPRVLDISLGDQPGIVLCHLPLSVRL